MCGFLRDVESSTGSLICPIMKTSLLVMVMALHALCKASSTPGQGICEVFPKNQLVKYGSDVVVLFRAPVNSDCYNKTGFDPSRVSWKLNNRRIENGFSNTTDDATFSVSIPNFSLKTGTVEFLMDEKVLSGTRIQTYSVPQNISCVGKLNNLKQYTGDSLICTWDHDQYTTDTIYILQVQFFSCQETKGSDRCVENKTCLGKSCEIKFTHKGKMAVTVIAKTPAIEAPSDEVTYDEYYLTVQLDPPEKLTVEPELNGLRVNWEGQVDLGSSCEVRFLAERSKPVVKVVYDSTNITVELNEMKECTNYSISVRCKIKFWSEWSQNVTHLTYLNVSNVQFHLWRSTSVADGKEKRRVHLMWKGIPPSCKAFDEYRLFDQTGKRSFGPYENQTFIYVDEKMHRISVAAFKKNKSLGEASIEIPSTEEDFILPPVANVTMFAGGGQIYVTWNKPNLTVSGYIIVWNSTENNHMWQHTEETYFYLKGEHFILYTISLTPLYNNSPGSEVQLSGYAQERGPAKMLTIRAERIEDRKVEIHWQPILPTECCAFVMSYTVFYKAQHESRIRNVSVDKNQHYVTLKNLKPSTTYSVYVQANAVNASSKSVDFTFSTKFYGEDYFIGLTMCGVVLILIPVFAVFFIILRKKYLSEKFPNPRLSSLSVWSSQSCNNPWNQLAMPWECESEQIIKCQVESEERGVGKLIASATDHNFTIQETAMTATSPDKENTALVRPNDIQLASHSKEERRQPLQPVDHQIKSQNTPAFPTQSPYRHQSPVTSPVDSPKRLFRGTTKPRSSETETLLKQKPQNTALPITYVTVDMFEQATKST